MLTRIEALNFRCLRYVSRSLDPFHVLVGPNASGKTTFFDVVGFVSRLLNDGLEAAIEAVTPNPLDLLFGRKGDRFELAINVRLPDNLLPDAHGIRYELVVHVDRDAYAEIEIETTSLLPSVVDADESKAVPSTSTEGIPESLHMDVPLESQVMTRTLRSASFAQEVETGHDQVQRRFHTLSLPQNKSALANLPEDETLFPASLWLKQFLRDGIATLSIDGTRLQRPSPPENKHRFHSGGLSMPWTVLGMSEADRAEWIEHIQTALPDIVGIRPVIRDEDRHCYLMIQYQGLAEIPQWMVSEGTLRLMALTLPAFSGQTHGVLMVEEPENGIHPKAIETVYQALSTVSDSQVLMTTHSPVVVNIAEPADILCFAKNKSGVVSVVRGSEHPSLIDWQHDISLGTLFAAGVLE